MADKSKEDAPANQENAQQPNISIHAQYIKDLSFENPGAPVSLTGEGAPEIDMSLDLHVQRLPEEGSFEVALQIEASAKRKDETLFVVELVYGAVFTLQGIPEEHHKSVLAVHCPAMIFPFARKIVADVTQDGGFQPLMIDPIDFAALYHRNMMQEQEAAEEGK